MHILFMNTHILLHMHNSIIIRHIHDIISLIMVQIFNLKHFKKCTAKVNEKWNSSTRKVLAAA